MFFNISTQELLVILLVALVVVGPQKLPELSRAIGRGMREFRRMQDEVKDMVKIDLNPEPPSVHQPGVSGPTPARPPHRSPRPGGVGRIVEPNSDEAPPEGSPPDGASPAEGGVPVSELPDVPDESADGPPPTRAPGAATGAADGVHGRREGPDEASEAAGTG